MEINAERSIIQNIATTKNPMPILELEVTDNLIRKDVNAYEILKNSVKPFLRTGYVFDGKKCLTEMKKNKAKNLNQTEWQAFFIESMLQKEFFDGRKYNNTIFDFSYRDSTSSTIIDGDIKTHTEYKAGKKADSVMILNDLSAMDEAINVNGVFYLVTVSIHAEIDYDYEFKIWRSKNIAMKPNLKKSGRKQKTGFLVQEILVTPLYADDYKNVFYPIKQGKNSNGKPRPPKYAANYKKLIERSLIVNPVFIKN